MNERKQTYGTTAIGDGDFFWLVDFGYGRTFKGRITIQPEMSIGEKIYYTNYKDNRFRDGGYSLVNNSEKIMGCGMNLGYKIVEIIEPFFGYNTIKQFSFGIKMHLSWH